MYMDIKLADHLNYKQKILKNHWKASTFIKGTLYLKQHFFHSQKNRCDKELGKKKKRKSLQSNEIHKFQPTKDLFYAIGSLEMTVTLKLLYKHMFNHIINSSLSILQYKKAVQLEASGNLPPICCKQNQTTILNYVSPS